MPQIFDGAAFKKQCDLLVSAFYAKTATKRLLNAMRHYLSNELYGEAHDNMGVIAGAAVPIADILEASGSDQYVRRRLSLGKKAIVELSARVFVAQEVVDYAANYYCLDDGEKMRSGAFWTIYGRKGASCVVGCYVVDTRGVAEQLAEDWEEDLADGFCYVEYRPALEMVGVFDSVDSFKRFVRNESKYWWSFDPINEVKLLDLEKNYVAPVVVTEPVVPCVKKDKRTGRHRWPQTSKQMSKNMIRKAKKNRALKAKKRAEKPGRAAA